jgi:hypothetical protein
VVGITAGSREVPGRKPVTRDNNNNNIIILIIIIILKASCKLDHMSRNTKQLDL